MTNMHGFSICEIGINDFGNFMPIKKWFDFTDYLLSQFNLKPKQNWKEI